MREALDPWSYIAASYLIGVVGTLATVGWSWWSMKRAEARREKARGK